MSNILNIAIVGLGYWGPNHLRTFYQLDSVCVKKVCDLDHEKWNKIASGYSDIEYVPDLQNILDDEVIDAVVIVADTTSHYDIAKKCLQHKKHAFVEKPLTSSSNEAQELVDLAVKADRILMVGHLLKYHPAVSFLKSLIDSNELGEIKYCYSVRVNLGKVRTKRNALWSLAPHDISVLLYLLGSEPEVLSAIGASYLREGIDDVVFATLKFPHNVLFNLHVSWMDPQKVRRITIVGDKKMCVFDDMETEKKLKIYHNESIRNEKFDFYSEEFVRLEKGELVCPALNNVSPLQIECRHFVECIRQNRKPLSDGSDGVRVIKVLENIQNLLDQQ